MLPKTRLGKRSPLGALLNATCVTGDPGITVETEHPAVGRVKGHPGLKVYFQCGGGESFSGVDPLDVLQNDVSSHPSSVPPSCRRSVSSCIDVPRSQRSPEQVDVDELMAAMVLSSLSRSMNSPPEPEALQMDCGGDLSDSSSGYWSVGLTNGSPTPSPPITEPGEAPRKRRNSVKVAYRCLWPSCGKVLTSVVGIKRHIRTTHLSRGSDHERCSRSEEDFYYSEAPPVSHFTSSVAPPTSCLRQVQSDHSYQAPAVSHVTSSVAPPTSCLRQEDSWRGEEMS
ncbi:Zinc finger protein 395 [Dissostichus eleginoides]|uniref:Zinc finger protein 395 n=1 Tax=Dissostichus eleginoides TaxID=100907 RepID=A0AAD9BYS4_DISEL|nr:Zinc finger protein 395 [Dissostichus eleginoides]